MSKLARRLLRMREDAPKTDARPPEDARRLLRRERSAHWREALGFEVLNRPEGLLHRRSVRFKLGTMLGRGAMGTILEHQSGSIAKFSLDIALKSADPGGFLFIDTETTGLAGGSGTVPFLTGISYFESGELVLEQLFVQELGQERPLLAYLAERLESASALVSYNGKSFDWPLLRTRMLLYRVPHKNNIPHLDLLHVCRRILKHRLNSIRLAEVEKHFLDYERVGDIEGAAIPELYFKYLAGEESDLGPVFVHNEIDLLALPSILGLMLEEFEERLGARSHDSYGYARVCERAGDGEKALRFAECDGGFSASWLKAKILKRRCDHDAAIAAFLEALWCSPNDVCEASAHLELAKIFEHKKKDLKMALEHAKKTEGVEGDEGTSRRLKRLRRKIEKNSCKGEEETVDVQ